jgi:hypothetical protein
MLRFGQKSTLYRDTPGGPITIVNNITSVKNVSLLSELITNPNKVNC